MPKTQPKIPTCPMCNQVINENCPAGFHGNPVRKPVK